jgi:lipid A 3-O-deacylase
MVGWGSEAVSSCLIQLNLMKNIVAVVVFFLIVVCAAAAQARPEAGGHELQLWSGGGHSVTGGTSNTGVWNVGVRYGWILTRPHGPGFLNGRFEYVIDAVPLFVIFQRYNTAYGAGFNPLGLKWDFATRGPVVPYFELSGGTLFANHDIPIGTSSVNFTSAAALGTHILGERYNWSLEVGYMHISNAGLATPNPGINIVQVRLGIGKFFAH